MKALPPSPGFLIIPFSEFTPSHEIPQEPQKPQKPKTHPAIDRLIRKVRENPTPNRQR